VCQLAFPRILSINEKSPIDFQERIRGAYPIYAVATEQQQPLLVNPGGVGLSPRVIQNERINNYSFSSEDNIWTIVLSNTSISLTTVQYTRWEDFETHLQEPVAALNDIYRPAFFERVGLRYINAFCRSKLQIDQQTPWQQLIKPYALGLFSNDDVASEIKGYSATTEVNLDNGAMARIVTATGYVGDTVFQQKPELSFIVDNDLFFNSRKKLDEISDMLRYLNYQADKIIHSIITEELHQSMQPIEL